MPADTFSRILDLYFGGDMEAAVGLAGQTAGLIDRVKPVKAIIDETVAEFFTITDRFAQMAAARRFG